jgi:hypothetical protein
MMVLASQEQLAFPFVIESVDPARVQLWAHYAMHSCDSDHRMWIVSTAFGGFFLDAACVHRLSRVMSRVQFGDVFGAVDWLDLLLDCVRGALSRWSDVVERLQPLLKEGVGPCYEDAMARVRVLTPLVEQVAEYVLLCCDQYQMAVPQYTAAYFKECERQPTVG